MTDREKVMWSLARCSCGVPDACSDCCYNNWPQRICVQHLTNDALALLKAQEPRVMTLEEALGEDECWIEGRSGTRGYGDALISDDGERVEFYRPHRIDTLDFYTYGIVWRCWSSRPTDEQREATPWEN